MRVAVGPRARIRCRRASAGNRLSGCDVNRLRVGAASRFAASRFTSRRAAPTVRCRRVIPAPTVLGRFHGAAGSVGAPSQCGVLFSFGSAAPTPYKCHTTPAGAHMQPHKCASCETLSPALVQWTMLLCTRYLALYPSIPRSIRGAKSSTCANADCCVPQWPDPRVPPAKVAKHERPLAGASSMLGGCWCRLCPLAHPASCPDRDAFVALGAGDELLRLRQERLGAWDRIRDVLVMLE